MYTQIDGMELYYDWFQKYNLLMAFIVFAAIVIALFIIPHNEKIKQRTFKLPLPLWAIVVIGLILRVPLMWRAFWYDESFTSAMVQASWGDMFVAVQGDVHPPLYYAIVKAFTSVLGHNDFVMRLPALLAGVALIVVMYHIGRNHHGESVARWVAFLTAVLPTTVYYSAEARYVMLLALMLGVAYTGIQKQDAKRVAVALSTAALLHVNAWFYVVVMLGLYILKTRKFKAVFTAILPGLAIAGWLPFALVQANDVADGFWLEPYMPLTHIIEMTIGERFYSHSVGFIPQVTIVLILVVAFWMYRRKARFDWLIMIAAVPAIQYLVGFVWNPIYLPRTMLISSLLLLLPVATWLHRSRLQWLAVLGICAICVANANLYYSTVDRHTESAVALCSGYDAIYTTSTAWGVTLLHWFDGDVYLYEDGDSLAQTLPLESKKALFAGVGELDEFDNQNICGLVQVGMWNNDDEMNYINDIALRYPHTPIRYNFPNSETNYYLALRLSHTVGWGPQ